MHEGDAADSPEPGPARPSHVPLAATRVTWRRDAPDPHDVARRYGIISTLLEAGVDAARIQVFHDVEEGGAYWVVTLDGGRTAVLTDDTEKHVGHMEGPWPFKAVLVTPDGARTRINHSIAELTAAVVAWHTEVNGS